MTNVIAFPRCAEHRPRPQTGGTAAYEFTAAELAKLCRWYSAMKYAFPQLQGVMTVSHKEKVSAVGLYGQGGTTPNCLISKHEADEQVYLLWATEITDAQIIAIEPPRNEASWLDMVGWMNVLASRTIGGHLDAAELSSNPA